MSTARDRTTLSCYPQLFPRTFASDPSARSLRQGDLTGRGFFLASRRAICVGCRVPNFGRDTFNAHHHRTRGGCRPASDHLTGRPHLLPNRNQPSLFRQYHAAAARCRWQADHTGRRDRHRLHRAGWRSATTACSAPGGHPLGTCQGCRYPAVRNPSIERFIPDLDRVPRPRRRDCHALQLLNQRAVAVPALEVINALRSGRCPPSPATRTAPFPPAVAVNSCHANLHLPRYGLCSHSPAMFCVSEAQAVVIRTAFEQRGELSAVAELRRLFPGVDNVAQARECVRAIAGWEPLPVRQPRAGLLRQRTSCR